MISDSSSSSIEIDFSDDDIPLVPLVTEVEIEDEPIDDFEIVGVQSEEEVIPFDHERIIDETYQFEETVSDSGRLQIYKTKKNCPTRGEFSVIFEKKLFSRKLLECWKFQRNI